MENIARGSVLIRKYADLTLPTPAYGGKVHTCFSPSKWKHFLCEAENLEPLDGVTNVLKRAVDKSQPLMRWAVNLALSRVRSLILATGVGGDGAVQLFVDELDKILAAAKQADTEALETRAKSGTKHMLLSKTSSKAVIANDDTTTGRSLLYAPRRLVVPSTALSASLAWLDCSTMSDGIKTEFRALSLKHKCCGTADGLGTTWTPAMIMNAARRVFKDRLSLIDRKTSNYLYTTYLWQTAFYVAAHEEEFPEIGQIKDRWILRLDKDDASFDPWHAEGREAQAEDLEGFLCCLALVRALERTETRMHAIVDARNAIRKARKLLEKQEQDRISARNSRITRAEIDEVLALGRTVCRVQREI